MMRQFEIINCRNGASYLMERTDRWDFAWGFRRIVRVLKEKL